MLGFLPVAPGPASASTRYLLFFRVVLLAALSLEAMYAPEMDRAVSWIGTVFPIYGVLALTLYGFDRLGRLPASIVPWSFLLDIGIAASAAYALPGRSMGFFFAFFLIVLSSTLLRKPAFSFLVAAAACLAYGSLSGGGPDDPGRWMKLALLAAVAFFSAFMTNYLRHIERGTAEPYERRIAWMERLSLAGRALSQVLHEVKTPLGTIVLGAENVRAMLKRGEDVEEELDVISQEAKRASLILTNFLEFTRPVEIELSPLDLAVPVGKTLTAMRPRLEERGIEVEERLRPGMTVLGSERHLAQALTNLIMNAIEAMPSGGRLTLSLEPEGASAVVRVADTGVGLDAGELEGVFDGSPSLRPDAKGYGLGLGIARWIAQKHGGDLSLESPGRGKGAAAVLRLPSRPGT